MLGFGLGLSRYSAADVVVIVYTWLLATGHWEDSGGWVDTAVWVD
jgi:hypothetical protein